MVKKILLPYIGATYQQLVKPFFFATNPEVIHDKMTTTGEILGKYTFTKNLLQKTFAIQHPSLTQKIEGITFINPMGLAAGFDYEAKLTQVGASLGFGFGSIGTITYHSYDGNPSPMLGRLPKSKSLLVNKGFKNKGAMWTAVKLAGKSFPIPLGISIGRTNSAKLSQKESIVDILHAFEVFEYQKIHNAYYELNISCPNLHGNVSFYPPKNLGELLDEIDQLRLKKPVFIKMPISESNKDILKMVDVISNHSPKGIIIGNLQKDRTRSEFDTNEIALAGKGNFSGKPTFARSNELISLTYKHFGKKLHIIGCGGVFSAEDAYVKIKRGASLIQLITGMIYQGPQLIGEINLGLVKLLEKDGYKNIAEAIGTM